MPGPRRRRKRRVWGWLPDRGELGKIALLLGALGAWWDARNSPDARTEGIAVIASAGAETDAAMMDSIRVLSARMGRLERRLAGMAKRGEAPPATPAAVPVQPQRGVTGWLSRLLGNRR